MASSEDDSNDFLVGAGSDGETITSTQSSDDEAVPSDVSDSDNQTVLIGSDISSALAFEEICRQERSLIAEHMEERRRQEGASPELAMACLPSTGDGQRFSVAFSGGGLRAASFQAGALWRLAELGCLKDVEYLAVVSGGSYIAAAMTSHIIDAGKPPPGANQESWYLKIVAKTLCRMQSNMPYLARDLGKNPFAFPKDGSSCLPRIFDIPILVFTCIFNAVITPICNIVLFVVPWIETFHSLVGATMRDTFCQPQQDLKRDWFGAYSMKWPRRLNRHRLVYIFVVILIITFLLHLILSSIRKKFKRTPTWWYLLNSSRAALMRFILLWVFVIVLVELCTTGAIWQFKFHDTNGRTRLCLCKDYVDRRMQGHDTHRCGDIPVQEEEAWYNDFKLGFNATTCLEGAADRLRELENPLGTLFIALPVAAGVSVVLSPWFPRLLVTLLNVMGPVVVSVFIWCLLQLRVFGPITQETFFHLSYNRNTVQVLLFVAILVQPVLGQLKSVMHRFYRRGLHRAFFADGQDRCWSEVHENPYCPYLLVNATVNDYKRPSSKIPVNEIFFSPLHAGGDKTGYVNMPSRRSLARTVALSGAAIDAFILGKHDHIRYRFWKDLLALSMGDFLRWPRRLSGKNRLQRSRNEERFRHRHSRFRITAFMIGEVYYITLYVANELSRSQLCHSARWLYTSSLVVLVGLIMLSFFAFVPHLDVLLHWAPVRTFHLLTQFWHQAEWPPSLVYVTDGGLVDNTGVVQLLRRRCRRMLLVYGGNDPKDTFKWLNKVVEGAAADRLASFYDPVDPRRDLRETFQAYSRDQQRPYLHIGVRYGWGEDVDRSDADLFIVTNNRVSPGLRDAPLRPLLSEEEIVNGVDPEAVDECTGSSVRQVELGGCCCDCCHRNGCNFGRKFPNPHNANQCLTPQLFNSLCRLGHSVSREAIEAVTGRRRSAVACNM